MDKKISVILGAIDNMTPVVDDATRSVDQLGDSVKDASEKGSGSLKKLNVDFDKMSLAAIGAGAAMVAFAESQQELASQSNKAAVSLGMTNSEFRDLATEVSNVTFPLNEAVTLLELAGKQGLTTEQELSEFATFWDTLGDATGESSEQLAKGASGLRAMGIAAGEEKEALNAYGIILQNTSLEVTKFNELASKNSKLARDNGMSIDDLAAAYAYMQNELGFTAEMMESEFERVITENKTQIMAYSQTLGDASGHVQALADAHDESSSIFDKFRQGISETSFKLMDQIKFLGDLGFAISGLGTIMKSATVVQGLYATFTTATGISAATAVPSLLSFAGAVVAATWPVLAIVAAIAAVIAIIVMVVKHFDTFKKVALISINFVKNAFEAGFKAIAKIVITTLDLILLPFKVFVNFIITGINHIISAINMLGGNIKKLDTLDLSIGDINLNRSSEQTINVNTTTQIDGRAVAKSTAKTTRRVAGSNAV